MAALDRLRADIGFHEKLFFGAMAMVVGVISWTWTRYADAERWQLIIAFIVISAGAVYNIYIYRKIKKLIEATGDV